MIMLTGNTRVRLYTRLFRKPLLVLQVEEIASVPDTMHSAQIDMFGASQWRDATVDDIADFRALHRKK